MTKKPRSSSAPSRSNRCSSRIDCSSPSSCAYQRRSMKTSRVTFSVTTAPYARTITSAPPRAARVVGLVALSNCQARQVAPHQCVSEWRSVLCAGGLFFLYQVLRCPWLTRTSKYEPREACTLRPGSNRNRSRRTIMATAPVITGAPMRAPSKVIPFPSDPIARMRLQLLHVRNDRMLGRWTNDLRRLRPSLDEADYAGLVARGAARKFHLSIEGAA